MIFIIYGILTFFILLEIFVIDPLFWKRDKSDKPWSTLFYVGIVGGLFLISLDWSVLFSAVSVRALFDPILNISGCLPSGKRYICYHSIDNKKGFALWYETVFKEIPCAIEMLLRIVWFFSTLIAVLWII